MIDNYSSAEAQVDRKSHRSFFHTLYPSKRVLRQMLDGIDLLLEDNDQWDYSKKSFQIKDSHYSPVNFCSLPAEIISKIFKTVVGKDCCLQKVLFTLSHINRQCRATTLHLPSLWTVITTRYRPEVVRMFLVRSQSQDLNVILFSDENEIRDDKIYATLKNIAIGLCRFRFMTGISSEIIQNTLRM